MKKTHVPQCFIAALFIITRTWKQPRCPSTDEWIKNYGTYIQWNITQPQKRNAFESVLMRWMNLEARVRKIKTNVVY